MAEEIYVFVLILSHINPAQLFITNTFSHNILSTSTAIYSQSAENFSIKSYQRVQISG